MFYLNEHLTHSCVGMPQCLHALSSSLFYYAHALVTLTILILTVLLDVTDFEC